MKSYVKSVVIILLALVFIGSAEVATASTGRVAVVDLDAIAKSLGRDKIITNKVAHYVKAKQAGINKERDQLKAKLAKEKKGLGNKSTDKQKADYVHSVREAELKLRNDVLAARRGAVALRAKLIQKFTDEVRPLAVKIAHKRGFSVVYVKQQAMLYVDPRVDISKDVAKLMSAGSSKRK